PCQYRCIECGYEAVELYKDFKAGIIKISHCVSCHKVVDKYIEFDPVIIFLDALLHKPQAYRHLLFNDKFKAPGRLLLIFHCSGSRSTPTHLASVFVHCSGSGFRPFFLWPSSPSCLCLSTVQAPGRLLLIFLLCLSTVQAPGRLLLIFLLCLSTVQAPVDSCSSSCCVCPLFRLQVDSCSFSAVFVHCSGSGSTPAHLPAVFVHCSGSRSTPAHLPVVFVHCSGSRSTAAHLPPLFVHCSGSRLTPAHLPAVFVHCSGSRSTPHPPLAPVILFLLVFVHCSGDSCSFPAWSRSGSCPLIFLLCLSTVQAPGRLLLIFLLCLSTVQAPGRLLLIFLLCLSTVQAPGRLLLIFLLCLSTVQAPGRLLLILGIRLLCLSTVQAPGRLLLIFLLCDTYLKWESLQADRPHPQEYIFYATLEADFYKMFALAIIEWCSFCAVAVAGTKWLTSRNSTPHRVSTSLLVWSLVVSSFGKLLAIPAILWGQTHSAIYVILASVFIFTSNVSALKVLCPVGRLGAVVILGSAHLLQAIIGHQLFCWTSSHHMSNTSTPVIAYLSSVAR
ncbi:hypothetical protein NP493_348g00039, partial [Ridgeia piscesae]